MTLTKKDIFWKSWFWSIICGILVALIFWLISDIGSLFHGANGGGVFINLLIVFSIVGSYIGAGVVGWRIADKYHHARVRQIVRRYALYAFLSFVLLVGIVYSPVSLLAILWSFLAPLCVLFSLRPKKS
ncbi:MAG TPA: hypothetical protein VLG11_06235 [Candidatus Saccharimonadales bacterium]|nr:hypothetical protein [Candidatus Saccharimonadales bacterium]